MSDWITSNICDSKFCDLLSETWHHYVTSLFIGWDLVLHCWHLLFLVQITVLKIVIREVKRRFCGRKLHYTAPLTCRRKTKFPTIKPTVYLPNWQVWRQFSPIYLIILVFSNLLRYRRDSVFGNFVQNVAVFSLPRWSHKIHTGCMWVH